MTESKNKTYQYLLRDIVYRLKEEYYEIRKELNSKNNIPDTDPDIAFLSGLVQGYYCCLEVIRNYSIAFQVPLKEICLEDEIPI